MASSFPQILPMWWVFIFFLLALIFFSFISFLSEGVLISPKPLFYRGKKISSWLK